MADFLKFPYQFIIIGRWILTLSIWNHVILAAAVIGHVQHNIVQGDKVCHCSHFRLGKWSDSWELVTAGVVIDTKN